MASLEADSSPGESLRLGMGARKVWSSESLILLPLSSLLASSKLSLLPPEGETGEGAPPRNLVGP